MHSSQVLNSKIWMSWSNSSFIKKTGKFSPSIYTGLKQCFSPQALLCQKFHHILKQLDITSSKHTNVKIILERKNTLKNSSQVLIIINPKHWPCLNSVWTLFEPEFGPYLNRVHQVSPDPKPETHFHIGSNHVSTVNRVRVRVLGPDPVRSNRFSGFGFKPCSNPGRTLFA